MEVKQAFEYFGLLEQQFWRNLDRDTIDEITYHGELKPEDMLLYGEFGFVLLGLKPCMLVEFRTPLYFETVIQPVLFALKQKTLDYHVIQDKTTPESNLDGCMLIYAIDKPIQDMDLLLNTTRQSIPENTMANILDYPGHLPSNEKQVETMKSVIYFHERPNKGPLALTSFAIQHTQEQDTRDHFKRYFDTCKDKLDIHLKLWIQ